MKNLYNEADKNEILNRLENLKVDAVREWGKMNIVQMLAHLNVSIETPLGKNFPKRMFIGRLIGKLMKKKFLNDQPMAKNSPTDKMYIITDISIEDFEKEKQRAKELITLFYNNGKEKCSQHPHSFFGELTPDEWGILQWKHFDHHLRQLGKKKNFKREKFSLLICILEKLKHYNYVDGTKGQRTNGATHCF